MDDNNKAERGVVLRPVKTDPQHDESHADTIDAGGYCNSLVDDGAGGADSCGYRAGFVANMERGWTPETVLRVLGRQGHLGDFIVHSTAVDAARLWVDAMPLETDLKAGLARVLAVSASALGEQEARAAVTREEAAWLLHEVTDSHSVVCRTGWGRLFNCEDIASRGDVDAMLALLHSPIASLLAKRNPE